jgi:hypothetical protein
VALPRCDWNGSEGFSQLIHRVPVIVAASGVRVETGVSGDKKNPVRDTGKKFAGGKGFS